MKAYEIGTQEGLNSLRFVERADPVAGPGEAVVRVRLVCLNHRDMLLLNGTYGPRKPETRIPCSDGIGEITSVGEGVTGFGAGDRVSCVHFVSWTGGDFSMAAFGADLGITRDGWLAEQIVVPASALVKIPDSVSDDQAAPLPAAGVTAWNALVEVGKVRAGDTVLVLGTGGVSILALQIAKLHGARVAITSSSDTKLIQARALGADITINYRTEPDWAKALLEATGGRGADIVVETAGLASLPHSISAAAVNGRIVLIGALAGATASGLSNFSTIIGKNLTLKGITEGSRAMLESLVRAVDAGKIRPAVDKVFGFAEAPEAFAHLHSGTHFGKVMIRL
jgi:NADPH:quinone reductase-like Zn-dependent oxidoreductase